MRGTGTKASAAGDKLKGKLQHASGELTGNDELKAKGRKNKSKGAAKEKVGRVQNAIDALKS